MLFSILIFFGIICASSIKTFRALKYNRFKLFHYMLIWYAFIYCLVPLFYFENRENYYQVVYQRILSKDSNFIFESIIVLLGFIGFLVGYNTLKFTVSEDNYFKIFLSPKILTPFLSTVLSISVEAVFPPCAAAKS